MKDDGGPVAAIEVEPRQGLTHGAVETLVTQDDLVDGEETIEEPASRLDLEAFHSSAATCQGAILGMNTAPQTTTPPSHMAEAAASSAR